MTINFDWKNIDDISVEILEQYCSTANPEVVKIFNPMMDTHLEFPLREFVDLLERWAGK